MSKSISRRPATSTATAQPAGPLDDALVDEIFTMGYRACAQDVLSFLTAAERDTLLAHVPTLGE